MADPTPLSGLAKLAADTRGLKNRSADLESPTGTQYGRTTEKAVTAEGKADDAQVSADYAQETADEAAARAEVIAQLTAEANERAEDALLGLIEAKRLIAETDVELDEKIGQLTTQLGNTATGLLEARARIDDTFTEIEGVRGIASGAQGTATKAVEAAAAANGVALDAAAQALVAAGLSATKGRIWPQPTQPPTGVVHAWTAISEQSPSTRTENGVVRKNLISNPVVSQTRWWVAANGTGAGVDGGLQLTPSGFGTAYAYAAPHPSVVSPSNNRFAITAGKAWSLGITVKNTSSTSLWVAAGVAFYDASGGGGASASALTPRTQLRAGESIRLEHRGVVPAADTNVAGTLPLLYVYGNSAGAIAPSTAVTLSRDWQFEIADQPFTSAPSIFNGATPSDRDFDLWIDTTGGGNTPKRHLNGVWTAVTDKTATDAAALASTAAGAAKTADDKAVAARSAAETALANAKTADDKAVAARAQADTAVANAKTADDRALAAAGLAGSKGEVIYQLSAPTGIRANAANLWIRTTDNRPATYNGTTWVPITDKVAADAAAAASAAQTTATNAANAAKAAQDTATAAGNAAVVAQQTADGKPTLRWGTAGPTGTQPQGSWYFQTNAAGEIINQYQQTASGNGSTWSIRPITNEAIASLDVGKLRAISADIAEAVIQKIVAQTANIQTVNAANIFVSGTANLSTALIEKLFVEVVKARIVTATEGFIGSSALIDGAITARTIAADAFVGKTFDGVSFTGVNITGAIIRTRAGGKRVELREREIAFYSESGTAEQPGLPATIQAVGDAGGQTLDPIVSLQLGSRTIVGENEEANLSLVKGTGFAFFGTPSAVIPKFGTSELYDFRNGQFPAGGRTNLLDSPWGTERYRANALTSTSGSIVQGGGSSVSASITNAVVPSGKTARVRALGSLYLYVGSGTIAGTIALRVDGVVQQQVIRVHNLNRGGALTPSGSFMADLAAGSHKIEVVWIADGGSGSHELWNFSSAIAVEY